MSTIVRKSAIAVVAAVLSIGVQAQPFGRGEFAELEARQARQEQRIERGIARGDITRHEARRLIRAQREIAHAKAQAAADGRITRHEWHQLMAMLDQADAQIRHLRRDRDHPYGR